MRVTDLFTVETYPTLHQMTSGIEAKLRAGRDARRSLRRAVSLRLGDRRAENPRHGDHPRSRMRPARRLLRLARPHRARRRHPLQCGDPHADAFSRTASSSAMSALRSSPISRAREEYEECLIKAKFLTGATDRLRPDRDAAVDARRRLLSSRPSIWRGLRASARALGFAHERRGLRAALRGAVARSARRSAARALRAGARRPLSRRASRRSTRSRPERVWRVAVARRASRPTIRCCATRRRGARFTSANWPKRRSACGADEVLFLNERDEVCEGARMQCVPAQRGVLLTPPLACGLLPGTLRAHLLAAAGRAKACCGSRISPARVLFGNSLRGLARASLIEE